MYGKEKILATQTSMKKNKESTFWEKPMPMKTSWPHLLLKKIFRSTFELSTFFARMADDIADHHKLSSSEKVKILLYFDNALKLKIKTDIKVLNNMVDLFPELPFGKKYSRNLLKAFFNGC